ncbi:nucleotidyltransferase [Rossellomorea vietnamensis]|uniref:nucleotidyltransferase n=1 Tax=Rossellomorea vietnamensis TaxID=218284 RepID=UPI003D26A4AA
MTEIKEIGRFCPMDANGYLINDSRVEKIGPVFLKVVEEVIEWYQTHLKEDLHSIYIRGSVPRGLGIEGVSDLDTISLTNRRIKDLDLNWVEKAEQGVNKRFPCINGVEFSFYDKEDILNTEAFSIIPFMIKTHSVCVYGEDVEGHLPDYKADISLGNEHLVNVAKQIELAKEDLNGNDDREDIADCCGWIMKIIVRAGLALVIDKEKTYTRDLYPAYKLFSKHYPEKESEMKQAVEYAINPVDDPNEILDFLDRMGKWMIQESERWLEVHNPTKARNLKF